MDELSRLMAQSMGQRLGADIKSCMAESRAGFRRAAANDKPPNKRPHSFDADAAHTFDKGDTWFVKGEVLSLDGKQTWSASGSCAKASAFQQMTDLGARLAADIRDAAGGELPAFGSAW